LDVFRPEVFSIFVPHVAEYLKNDKNYKFGAFFSLFFRGGKQIPRQPTRPEAIHLFPVPAASTMAEETGSCERHQALG
jgi:hypothetical protein